MKKIIYAVGIIALTIVIVLNIVFTAQLDYSEHITINNNSFIYVIGIVLLGIGIFYATKFTDELLNTGKAKLKEKTKKITLGAVIAIYAILNIIWTIKVIPPIVGDQIHACNLAQTFYNNNLEEFLPNITYAGIPLSQYMQSYHQQISLSFVFSMFFRLIHFDGIQSLKTLNVIGNVAIIFALYKIGQQLSKKYKTNKTRLLFFILTFISIPMLSTFIYGDIPSLTLCLFSVYFMMKYTETRAIKYPVLASIFTMIAYMMRMNCLIFIIATSIYLLLNTFNNIKNKKWKELGISILITIMYIAVSIVPTILVQNYYLNKYNMDKDKEYPTISYFLMAMEESWRGNGWYSEKRGEYALNNIENAKTEYVDEIKNRVSYFAENKWYTFKFYTMKLASMWTENTYSAVRTNMVDENDNIKEFSNPLTFYQKSLLLVTCVCSLIFLIQNRKNLSNDAIYLITIFIGGFAFHILWEAKSRYIIPYIVSLIPIASMAIKTNEFNIENIKTKVSKLKGKILKTNE